MSHPQNGVENTQLSQRRLLSLSVSHGEIMSTPPVPQHRTRAAAKYLSQRGVQTSYSYLEKVRRRGPEDPRGHGPDFTRDEMGVCWYDEASLNLYIEQRLSTRRFRAAGEQPLNLRNNSGRPTPTLPIPPIGSQMTFDTTSSAAQKLSIPPGTLVAWERAGRVGPFQRDAAGRRLLIAADIEQIRKYMKHRSSK